MSRRNWLYAVLAALPLAALAGAGGWAYASVQASGFVCPITGEVLSCEKCCPLNDQSEGGYTCPINGEQLPCEKCCPLNDKQ